MLTSPTHTPIAASKRDAMTAFNGRAEALGWAFTCGPARDFEHAELTAAHAVWRDKAAGRAMPDRGDLTARSMKPFLTHMSLLERVTAGGTVRYRVRLHGSTLARYSGDSTGKFLEDCVSPERIESFIALYDTAMALRIPLRVVSYYQAPEIDYLMGESLLAPLAVPGCDTPILLSVTYAKPRADLARTPAIATRD